MSKGLKKRWPWPLPVVVDMTLLGALGSPQYRRFWFGLVAAVMGFQMFIVTQGWLVYELSDSPLYLGLIGLVSGVPSLGLNLFGGVLADRVNRRLLLTLIHFLMGLLVLVLATLTLLGWVQVWHVLVVAFLMGVIWAFEIPATQAFFPHLVDKSRLPHAIALNSMVWQATRVVGPSLGGLTIAYLGAAASLYASSVGFLFMSAALRTLSSPPLPTRRRPFFQDMLQGLVFVKTHPPFTFLIAMTFFNSFFGMSFLYLMPVFARDILQVGPSGLGFLYTASGLGSLAGTALAASLARFQLWGWIIRSGAVLFGTFLILFAFSPWFALSMVLLSMAGMSSSLYLIGIQTVLQSEVPDPLRGRVMGIYGMTWSLVPLGGMQAGTVASFIGAPLAVGLGGLAVVAFTLAVTGRQRRMAIQGLSGPAFGSRPAQSGGHAPQGQCNPPPESGGEA